MLALGYLTKQHNYSLYDVTCRTVGLSVSIILYCFIFIYLFIFLYFFSVHPDPVMASACDQMLSDQVFLSVDNGPVAELKGSVSDIDIAVCSFHFIL